MSDNMSVCFFVPSQNDNGGASNASDDAADGVVEDLGSEGSQQALHQFWEKVMEETKGITAEHFKTQALPLARIKKIMKLDEDVKMISAEAPILFAKAAEIFIQELTLRAWTHTEDNKRRTLQKNDIAMAISKSDQFDFLIDIVPRHDTVVTKIPRREPLRPSSDVQVVQPSATNSTVVQSSSPQPQIVLQPYTQFVQQQPTSGNSNSSTSSQQPVVLQQLVSPSDNIPVPIQLSPSQLNSLRMQMQGSGNHHPIIIQTQPQQGQQILQVSPSSQQQLAAQSLFLQVSSNSENDS